jgi:hypothetical protein
MDFPQILFLSQKQQLQMFAGPDNYQYILIHVDTIVIFMVTPNIYMFRTNFTPWPFARIVGLI